jgi:hypothetical protein
VMTVCARPGARTGNLTWNGMSSVRVVVRGGCSERAWLAARTLD